MNLPRSVAPVATPVGTPLGELLEALPHGVIVFGADHRVALVNRAYHRLLAPVPVQLGDSVEDSLRVRIAAGEYGPGEPDVLLARHLAYDVSRPQTHRRRRPNGTILENRWVPLADGGFMVVVTDITALVGAEQALVRRGAETEVLLAGLRHGLILWGPDQRLLVANPMAATLLGVPAEMLAPGRSHAELVDAMIAGGYFGTGPLAHAMAEELKGRDWLQPWVRHFVNPAGRFVERRADPVEGGMNITTFTDMTEQREAEHALRRAKEAAEAASQAKSRFLATLSHELRTPLNAVIGYSDSLVQETAVGPDQSPGRSSGQNPGRIGEYASAINAAGRRLLGLIDTLLDVARLETGRFDLAEDPVDVVHLIETSLRQFARAAEAAQITLEPALEADAQRLLPWVLGDRRRLAQVLHQLLSNALKFTEPGGRVSLDARAVADGMLLAITDTGIGIAPADLDRVFDPFTQVDTSLARRFPGVGVGLYLARALVESHGGTLSLRSREGAGTTAEVRLPAHRMLTTRDRPDGGSRRTDSPAADPAAVDCGGAALVPDAADPTIAVASPAAPPPIEEHDPP